jgi:hypothetical protein
MLTPAARPETGRTQTDLALQRTRELGRTAATTVLQSIHMPLLTREARIERNLCRVSMVANFRAADPYRTARVVPVESLIPRRVEGPLVARIDRAIGATFAAVRVGTTGKYRYVSHVSIETYSPRSVPTQREGSCMSSDCLHVARAISN